jgi:hypothetical protein
VTVEGTAVILDMPEFAVTGPFLVIIGGRFLSDVVLVVTVDAPTEESEDEPIVSFFSLKSVVLLDDLVTPWMEFMEFILCPVVV